VLSPCGGLEMSPRNLISRAKEVGLDIIAITDHNSMANCEVYQNEAHKNGIVCFWGVEIQTSEEIHIVALFESAEKAKAFDIELYESLLPIKNNPDFFGDQVVIDGEENIVRFEPKALINSSIWTLDEVIAKLEGYECLYYPAHIDAETYSIIGQLGFIPSNINFSTLGITAKCDLDQFLVNYPYLKGFSFNRSSDAHYLEEIGSGCTEYFLESPTIKDIRLACQKKSQINNDIKK
jgi:PHP family Zn ribbon phosphoesterase